MNKGLSLLDFVYLNQETDYLSTELKNLIKIYGSLEYNIGKHIRLMNKIYINVGHVFGGHTRYTKANIYPAAHTVSKIFLLLLLTNYRIIFNTI